MEAMVMAMDIIMVITAVVGITITIILGVMKIKGN